MALLNPLPTQYGANAVYWKITATFVNWLDRQCHITLHGWVDEEARRAGLTAIDRREFAWYAEQFPFAGPGDPRPVGECVSTVYEAIKRLAEFADAQDV